MRPAVHVLTERFSDLQLCSPFQKIVSKERVSALVRPTEHHRLTPGINAEQESGATNAKRFLSSVITFLDDRLCGFALRNKGQQCESLEITLSPDLYNCATSSSRTSVSSVLAPYPGTKSIQNRQAESGCCAKAGTVQKWQVACSDRCAEQSNNANRWGMIQGIALSPHLSQLRSV